MVGVGLFLSFFLIFWSVGGGLISAPAFANQTSENKEKVRTQCTITSVKTPPIFVVPTGYDTKSEQDAVERRREDKYANYYKGNTAVANNLGSGKPFYVPKRSIVQVSDSYRNMIEKTGEFSRSRNDEWLPVKVLSTPPENGKLQEAYVANTKSIGKPLFSRSGVEAKVGDVGFMKISDLEKVDKQKDFVFVVKQDSELFTKLNNYINKNDYKALLPLALRLKKVSDGYEVNQCCVEGTNRCTNYPIFEVIGVKDEDGKDIDLPLDTDCFICQRNIFKSLVPIEDAFLNPIRSILSHPTLGLPEGANEIKKAASISNLNFVDSRGFVQIPLTGDSAKRTGPFNSLHYGSESGDADAYLKPDVACGFMQFLKTWNQSCKGGDDCLIEFGDASHANYKNRIPGGERGSPWPHQSHTDGECIDINTSRMNSNYLGPMMNMLKKLGQVNCLTRQSKITGQGGCSYDRYHDTHMHICFPSNTSASGNSVPNPRLKEACEKGVKP